MAEATYSIEYAKSGRSTCKGTKEKIEKDALRIAKITLSDRAGTGDPIQMSAWYLPIPFFQMMKRMRKGSKVVESTFDLAGFDELKEEDQQLIEKYVKDYHDADVDFPPKPPKKEKKRKEESEDGAAAAPAPSPKKKPKVELGGEFEAETRAGVNQSMLRDITDELVGRLKAAGYNVPEEGGRQQLGPICMSCLTDETLDVGEVLKQGAIKFGKKSDVECKCEANAAMAGAFLELSSFEFKGGASMKGVAYKKVSAALADHPTEITSGKEATKLPGIGKSSAEKIDQFLATGKIEKLEEYKNQV